MSKVVARDVDYAGPRPPMKSGLNPTGKQLALHQDPRFYQLGKGGFWHRTRYAVSRITPNT
jgi:hypothetical protein